MRYKRTAGLVVALTAVAALGASWPAAATDVTWTQIGAGSVNNISGMAPAPNGWIVVHDNKKATQPRIALVDEFTARCHNLITGRRGQILNFGAKDGWPGWDMVEALLPQSELHDLIIELRSLTLGVGNFAYRFDHLQELTGRLADKVVEQRQAAAAAAH